jgi:hypothetical protein
VERTVANHVHQPAPPQYDGLERSPNADRQSFRPKIDRGIRRHRSVTDRYHGATGGGESDRLAPGQMQQIVALPDVRRRAGCRERGD